MKKNHPSQQPVVSVIIPTYNCADTLEVSLQSVLNQDFKDKEIIIVDGGSSDGTLDLLKKYDDQIDKWVSEPDKGVYDALNKGIDLANGEWLYFLGSDDRLYDDTVFEKFFSTPTDSEFLYGDVMWGENGEVVAGEFTKERFYTQNICQQAIFYNKKLFQKIGKFNLKYRLVADWVFNMKAFGMKNVNPLYIDTVVAIYSLGGMSTNIWDEDFIKDRNKLFIKSFGILSYINYKGPLVFEKALKHSPRLRAIIDLLRKI